LLVDVRDATCLDKLLPLVARVAEVMFAWFKEAERGAPLNAGKQKQRSPHVGGGGSTTAADVEPLL